MNTLKRFACVLLFFPMISFAALDASFNDVSTACYRTFKAVFAALPAIAPEYGYILSNMQTPSGNPSTYTFTVEFTPSGEGLGDYALYQKHSNNTLYLRLDSYPDTFPVESADKVWTLVDELLDTCTFLDQIN